MGELVGSGQRLDRGCPARRDDRERTARLPRKRGATLGSTTRSTWSGGPPRNGPGAMIYWRSSVRSTRPPTRRLGGRRPQRRRRPGLTHRALHAPYADRPDTRGHGYLSAEADRRTLVLGANPGRPPGGLVSIRIGDAGESERSPTGRAACGETLADDRARAARHRLEHVEMPSQRVIDVSPASPRSASVQPMFDALWGGPEHVRRAAG